jgi:hypothetical protein
MNRLALGVAALAAVPAILAASDALAHGFAGKRFFPATIATDDPFVADELSLPTVSTIRNSGDAGSGQEIDVGVDIAKRITPSFGIEVGETWQHFSNAPPGFANTEVGAKYLLLRDDPHELLFSAGLNAEIGGTGARRVGADRFSTLTPAVFFGKGFGDLPDSLTWLKPFAVTGSLGVGFPMRTSTVDPDTGDVTRNPNTLETGFAIEYSLQYLQSFVRDVGLPAPFNRLIPLVEFNFSTPLNRGVGGQTTGTINPGLIWAGQYFQIGAEAIIPANSRSGRNVGGIIQLHFFIDDLFPNSLGKPIFGG